jgi:hypothetical protein
MASFRATGGRRILCAIAGLLGAPIALRIARAATTPTTRRAGRSRSCACADDELLPYQRRPAGNSTGAAGGSQAASTAAPVPRTRSDRRARRGDGVWVLEGTDDSGSRRGSAPFAGLHVLPSASSRWRRVQASPRGATRTLVRARGARRRVASRPCCPTRGRNRSTWTVRSLPRATVTSSSSVVPMRALPSRGPRRRHRSPRVLYLERHDLAPLRTLALPAPHDRRHRAAADVARAQASQFAPVPRVQLAVIAADRTRRCAHPHRARRPIGTPRSGWPPPPMPVGFSRSATAHRRRSLRMFAHGRRIALAAIARVSVPTRWAVRTRPRRMDGRHWCCRGRTGGRRTLSPSTPGLDGRLTTSSSRSSQPAPGAQGLARRGRPARRRARGLGGGYAVIATRV